MEKLDRYRSLIKLHFTELAELVSRQRPSSMTGVECECVFDEQRDQYLLLKTGWSGNRRVRATTLHVRIRNQRICIEEDMTEDGIAATLLREGVSQSEIVLAFQPLHLRERTEIATV